jgi:hypothetical protein
MRGVVAAIASLVLAIAAGAAERVIRYEADTLSVRLTDAALDDVVAEIGRQADAPIRGRVRDGRVSATFDRVPLDDALVRLLGDRNFALRYGEGGRLREIALLSDQEKTAGGGGSGPPPGLLRTTLAVRQAVAGYAPVPVSGRAAEALGATRASMTDLMRTAMRDKDPHVRSDALQAGLLAMEDNPDLRAAVFEALGKIGDPSLITMLRRAPDGYGERLLEYVATQMSDPEMRAKADALLTELRQKPATGGDRR